MQSHSRGASVPAVSGDPRSARARRGVGHDRALAPRAPDSGKPPDGPRAGYRAHAKGDRRAGGGAGTAARCAFFGAKAARGFPAGGSGVRSGGGHDRRVARNGDAHSVAVGPALRRPVVEPTSPERYRVQFTVGKETHDKLRRLQELLRREIPDGDPGAIFDRAVTLLLERVERKKLGAAAKPRPAPSIRPGTDRSDGGECESRDIPRNVRRAVSKRDGGQCGYVGPGGHRCPERTFLEFHHIVPYARGGRATVDNISLRCRRHNQYEAELAFGASVMEPARGKGRRPPSSTLASAAPRTP